MTESQVQKFCQNVVLNSLIGFTLACAGYIFGYVMVMSLHALGKWFLDLSVYTLQSNGF